MMLQVYTLHDRVADTYTPPFYASNDEEAIRSVRYQLYSSPTSQLSVFSADYALMLIGSFDDQTGQLRPREDLKSLGLLSGMMPRKDDEDV